MNRIGYYIREGVDSIFNHGLISFTTICVILACLLIMGSFASVAVNVNHIIGNLEDQVSILAFVDEKWTEQEVYDFLRSRRSMRQFRKEAPRDEDILKLLNVCRYAPTAGNSQGMYFTVIRNPGTIEAIRNATADWMQAEVDAGTANKRYFKAVLHTYHEKHADIITRNAPALVFLSARCGPGGKTPQRLV